MKFIITTVSLVLLLSACQSQKPQPPNEDAKSESSAQITSKSSEKMMEDTFEKNGNTMKRYQDDRTDISFDYRVEPDGYTAVSTQEDTVLGIALIKTTDYDYMKDGPGRGGPPAINLIIYPNDDGLSALEWALENSAYSNLQDEELVTAYTLAGIEGIRYSWEGMFNGETVIISDENNVYMFSGTSHDGDTAMKEDFDAMLRSVTLQ